MEGSAVTVHGRLIDDAGRGISGSGTHVRLRLRAGPEGAFMRLPVPQGCELTSAEKVHYALDDAALPDEYRIDPEEGSGTFCVRLPGISAPGVVELSYEGSAYYTPHSALYTFDAGKRSLNLRFSPEPTRVSLDRASSEVAVDTELEPPLARDENPGKLPIELLFDDSAAPARSLGTTLVRPGDRAVFEVFAKQLGRPGRGRFIVRYAGAPALHASERSAVVRKTLRAQLSVAGSFEAADPRDGIAIKVAVGSAQGAVDGGSIEARVGSDSVGTANVVRGAADLVVLFEAAHAGTVPLELAYLPAAPWWEPDDPVRINLPVKAPSAWRRLPWFVSALAIAAWVIKSWQRPARAKQAAAPPEMMPSGQAALSVIEARPRASGWTGRVIDAHDGSAISGARVAIVIPAFGGDGTARLTETDANGRFQLEHVRESSVEGARMQTSARWHTALTRPVPAAGEVVIALVNRRRALIERLVQWAEYRGRPWKQSGDATPEHVRRTAHVRHARDIADWASAVETAAFGPVPPDETVEERLRAREPEWSPGKSAP